MLEPQDRTLLLDALKPPPGYSLDFAIGTTYTLDLLALLTAPLGFTLYELRGTPTGDLSTGDALVLLKTLRDYADRMTIFCEAGRVAVPEKHSILLGYLEGVIAEVEAPAAGRTFHPKVWVLRFRGADEDDVCYRFLCLSRNFTFDRSWDTVLMLQGPFESHRTRGHSDIRPVADFVAALPAMVVGRPMSERMLGNIAQAVRELPRVAFDFEAPQPFDDFKFHPLGIAGATRWPFRPADRMLIVSPFLAGSALAKLTTGQGKRHVLVSRPEELARFSQVQLHPFTQIYQLNPDVIAEQSGDDQAPAGEATASLLGLHAKLYVAEHGWNASVFTGSANATNAAFDGNVEFIVELIGKKSKCGIDAILSSDATKTGLRDLLQDFVPADPVPPDAVEEQLDKLLNEARAAVARRLWTATVTQNPDTPAYSLALTAGGRPIELPPGVQAWCHPLMLPPLVRRVVPGMNTGLTFNPVSFEALSSFFAVNIRAELDGRMMECSFTINAQLLGAPANRREAITQYLLRDRQQVMRFLLMLLSDNPQDVAAFGESDSLLVEGSESDLYRVEESQALLEPLLRALDRDPSRLDATAQVLEDLSATEEGRAKLPLGLDAVWIPIWTARQALSE